MKLFEGSIEYHSHNRQHYLVDSKVRNVIIKSSIGGLVLKIIGVKC